MAYTAVLPFDDRQYLDPKFVGLGKSQFDMEVRGELVRGMNLYGCFKFHVRVPPRLLADVPTRIVVTRGKGDDLPDFGLAPWGGWGLVSSAFVDVVERLEPGVHEFLRIAEVVDRKGRVVEKRYFLMNVLQCFNAIDVERSSVELNEHKHDIDIDGRRQTFTSRTMRLVEPYVLTLKRVLVVGHHLWHGTNKDIFLVFFSDALHDAVTKAGLSPLHYHRAEEA